MEDKKKDQERGFVCNQESQTNNEPQVWNSRFSDQSFAALQIQLLVKPFSILFLFPLSFFPCFFLA